MNTITNCSANALPTKTNINNLNNLPRNIEHPIEGPDIDLSSYFQCLLEVKVNSSEFDNDEVELARFRLDSKSPLEVSKDYFINTLGRKWRGELSKLCTYILVFIKVFRKDGSIKPISSWSHSYQKYLPKEFSLNEQTRRRALSKVLTQLDTLGVIEKVNDKYAFTKDSKCYCYLFNKDLGKKILRWVKDNDPILFDENYQGIEIDKKLLEVNQSLVSKDVEVIDDLSNIEPTCITENQEVTKDSINNPKVINYPVPLKITSRTRLNLDLTNEQLMESLSMNYPYLPRIMEKVNSINNTIANNPDKFTNQGLISYNPHMHKAKSGYTTGISIRAASPLSNINARKNLDDTKLGFIETREDILLHDWYGISSNASDDDYNKLVEFDVKASVPRVTYLINNKVWLPNEVDLYKSMFGITHEDGTEGYMYGLTRKHYKLIFMYLYFNRTKSNAIRCVLNHLGRYDDFLREAISQMYDSMVSVIGNPLGSEIFLHESNIYILVRDILIHHLGLDVAQVYDAFILKREDINKYDIDIYKIIKECAMDYQGNYLSNNHVSDVTSNIDNTINKVEDNIDNKRSADKILVISDYHIDNYRNYSPTNEDYDNQGLVGPKDNFRLNQSVTFAKALVQYGMKNNIKNLFILGDFLNRANSGPKIVNTGAEVITILRSWFTLYYILGQHDLASRANDVDPYDTFMTIYSKLHGVNPMYYVHNKGINFINTKGEEVLVRFKNFQFNTEVVDFGECDVACGHLSLTLGQRSSGTHKLGIFGDIHDLVQDNNEAGGIDYSVGTPYQHFPSQPEEGHFGILDISDKGNLRFSRILSDSLIQ